MRRGVAGRSISITAVTLIPWPLVVIVPVLFVAVLWEQYRKPPRQNFPAILKRARLDAALAAARLAILAKNAEDRQRAERCADTREKGSEDETEKDEA